MSYGRTNPRAPKTIEEERKFKEVDLQKFQASQKIRMGTNPKNMSMKLNSSVHEASFAVPMTKTLKGFSKQFDLTQDY